MQKYLILGGALIAVILTSGTANAGIVLSLSSSPASPATVSTGTPVTVTVNVSGITTPLSALGVKVLFDNSFQTGNTPTAGTSVPLSGLADFAASTDNGLGETLGLYDSFLGVPPGFVGLGVPITTDGAFYSFQLTSFADGSGTVSIDEDLFQTFAFDENGDPVDIDSFGSPLTINAVPEPSSLLLLGAVGGVSFIPRLLRKRTRRRNEHRDSVPNA